tara:strand:+ start:536 stop:739 length:204 start_codon:yes stop_codon:yes gene_type:complete
MFNNETIKKIEKFECRMELKKTICQHRINFIAGFLPACESPLGLSWFVFYLLTSLLKQRNKAYTNTL